MYLLDLIASMPYNGLSIDTEMTLTVGTLQESWSISVPTQPFILTFSHSLGSF